MDNPFQINYPDHVDSALIQLAVQGDKRALNSLVARHQIFVYNLALKMTRSVDDANDLTQEVFIKAITSLSKFEQKSQFRTWLYRIAVNHFLSTRKKKAEQMIDSFESYFASIDKMSETNLNEAEAHYLNDAIEELRISCTAGMIMCLDRNQRLIFILGEMFQIDHKLGAKIMDISPGNFRVKLSRARKDLQMWMHKKCGLVNAANPCRCAKKTHAYIEQGFVNPQKLQFNRNYTQRILELSTREALNLQVSTEEIFTNVFGTHPLQQPNSGLVEEIFNNRLIKEILEM